MQKLNKKYAKAHETKTNYHQRITTFNDQQQIAS